jgi:hypothetical protein
MQKSEGSKVRLASLLARTRNSLRTPCDAGEDEISRLELVHEGRAWNEIAETLKRSLPSVMQRAMAREAQQVHPASTRDMLE